MTHPGPRDALTDVAGLTVGHHQRLGGGWATGTTVVLAPAGATGGVDVRGGGPGTRETDLLDPSHLVQQVQAVVLTGGSAYGLAAADGVVGWLAERGHGFRVGPAEHHVVPIVPAAVLFDLHSSTVFGNVPDAAFGRAACEAAGLEVAQGCVGAGTGARAGVLQGGIGTASAVLADGTTVAALVAVNPAGSVVDPRTGLPWAADPELDGLRAPVHAEVDAFAALADDAARLNTTIGVVATDAGLTKPQCRRLAVAAHDGLARAVRPAHSMLDGDTFFALATGEGAVDVPRLDAITAAGADCVARAIVHAVLAATTVTGVRAYRDVLPSALA
ncbi:P1 family peptidase [Rhodococcus antarcticus]|uniref:P1 family peptidase n=1 Tax=Rhodococcus antarcticus TaxID=2987751 RepID=A0ABY6NY63_9NOCA|nr:P1 family peptidase [Rhodococcus antarcticus]UZJ23873.1 P1 family peptidase [Rhodococcus antarcticus]